jgi:osmotically-inducible protein OsmY
MNRNQQNGRHRDQQRGMPGYRQREQERAPFRAQDEQRYFPQDDDHNRRYQSGGYQEEVGNYGDQDAIQGPNRQGRDWQAEQREDFGDHRGNRGGQQSGQRSGGDDFGFGQTYGERYGQRGGSSYRTSMDNGTFWPSQGSGDRTGGESGQRSGGESFRGHGPKGYKRSDDRLKEMICEKLMDDESIDARDITVEVKDGEVTLSGTVANRQLKYQAEDLIERCGVDDVTNNLRISRSGDKAGDKGSMQSASKSAGRNGDKHADHSEDDATDASRAGRKGSATTTRAGL